MFNREFLAKQKRLMIKALMPCFPSLIDTPSIDNGSFTNKSKKSEIEQITTQKQFLKLIRQGQKQGDHVFQIKIVNLNRINTVSSWMWPKTVGLSPLEFHLKDTYIRKFFKEILVEIRDKVQQEMVGQEKTWLDRQDLDKKYAKALTLLHLHLITLNDPS